MYRWLFALGLICVAPFQVAQTSASKFEPGTSAAASIATGWSEPVPGRELHPLKSSAFSRRTVTTVTIRSRPTTRWKPLKSRSLAVSLQFSTELFTTNYRTNLTQMG